MITVAADLAPAAVMSSSASSSIHAGVGAVVDDVAAGLQLGGHLLLGALEHRVADAP